MHDAVPNDLPAERWQIRIPRPGTQQGEFRGEEAFFFDLDVLAGDQLERTLRRANPRLRRGRPLIYRNSREVEPDPDEGEDRTLVAAKLSAQDPEEQAQVLAIKELRDLRRQLSLDCDARRRELEQLGAMIEKGRLERDRELERIRVQVEKEQEHGQKRIREVQEAQDAELRRVRKMREEMEASTTADLQQIGAQISLVRTARAEVNQILRAPTLADMFGQVKEGIVAAVDSPLGQTVNSHVAARIAAAVSKQTEKKVEPADVLAGFALQGRALRARHDTLRQLRLEELVDSRAGELAVAGADFVVGLIDLKTVASMLRERDTTLTRRTS